MSDLVTTPVAAAAGGYRERIMPPWWTWPLAVFWASTLGIAYGHALGVVVGVVVGALAFALATAGLLRAALRVVVDPRGLTVGRAYLPHECIAGVEALDAVTARRRRGPEADPRTFSAIRGWVATAVMVTLDDPQDPTPSWYVSTRRPARLAAALTSERTADMTGSGTVDPGQEGA